jgi:hypothetical protein
LLLSSPFLAVIFLLSLDVKFGVIIAPKYTSSRNEKNLRPKYTDISVRIAAVK